MTLDLTIVITAWGSIILGSVLTHFLIENYEKIKDKVKIKEKLVDLANKSWQKSSQIFFMISIKQDITDINKKIYEYSENIDYLEGLVRIYSNNPELLDNLLVIKSDVNKNRVDLTTTVNNIENASENIQKIRQAYNKVHEKNNENFRVLFSIIKDLKIKYFI